MSKRYIKNFIIVFLIIIFLIIITVINVKVFKNNSDNEKNLYKNELSYDIDKNDISKIDYDYIQKDLYKLDNIIKEQLKSDVDIKKKTEYYESAQNIYSNKINEIMRILNDKLDDEDFHILELDIDEFYKNIDFAIEEINNTNKSSIDVKYNINKYMYEEKQRKCHEIIENYKGFLKE